MVGIVNIEGYSCSGVIGRFHEQITPKTQIALDRSQRIYLNMRDASNAPRKQEFKVPVAAKFCETILSSLVHSQNRTGELYLIRIFDFVFTFTILVVGKHMVPSRATGKPEPVLM
ncbi:hypothetical protein OSTOST_12668, partial [Ostertagia ostertagi]